MQLCDLFQWRDGPVYMITRISDDWVLMMVEHGTHSVEYTWRKSYHIFCDARWKRI